MAGDATRGTGAVLMLGGTIATAVSFFLPTSIGSQSLADASARLNAAVAGYPLPEPGSVINIGKLQDQLMVFQLGVGAFIAGAILFVGGAILIALSPPVASMRRPEQDEPDTADTP